MTKKTTKDEIVDVPQTEAAAVEQPTAEEVIKTLYDRVRLLENQNLYLKAQLDLAKEMIGVNKVAA